MEDEALSDDFFYLTDTDTLIYRIFGGRTDRQLSMFLCHHAYIVLKCTHILKTQLVDQNYLIRIRNLKWLIFKCSSGCVVCPNLMSLTQIRHMFCFYA